MKNYKRAFTLIEILVVITIIGIIISLSAFGLKGSRETGRDAKRKSDLEAIRSALELYRADCNKYPVASIPNVVPSPLQGDDTSTSCLTTNTYIDPVPDDPIATRKYFYDRITKTTYEICAYLEGESGNGCGTNSCGDGLTCNYRITNP